MVTLRGRALLSGGLVLAIGCGPDTVDVPTTELDELCGAPEPLQLLSVGEDDYPARYTRRLQFFGDRLVFGYATNPPGVEYTNEWAVLTTTIYSVGLCGEDPRPIGEGIDVLYDPEAHAGSLLGCSSDSGDVFALDVDGVEPPRLLLPAVGCIVHPHRGGIVGIQREPEAAIGTLVFRPTLADPGAQARVVLDGIVVPDGDPEAPDSPTVSFGASDQAVLALTQDGRLVSVDAHTSEHQVLREEVGSFVTSADLRWVLWQQGNPSTEPPGETSTLRLLDRELGEDLVEDVGLLGPPDTGIVENTVRIARDDGSSRLVMLPSLLQLDIGPEWVIHGSHPSGVVFLKRDDNRDLSGLDPETGETWPLLEGKLVWVEDVGDEALILHEKHTEREFSYWRVPVRGGEPELLASHVLAPVWLPDGRLGTTRHVDDSLHGQLWIMDPETDEGTVLDSGVFWRTLGPRTIRGHSWSYDDDVVLWSVHDRERSGLWAARIQ